MQDVEETHAVAEAPVIVLDVPLTSTPDEAVRLLSEPCLRGFHLSSILPWPGAGARVFMIHRTRTALAPRKRRRNSDGREDAALAIIRTNPTMSSRKLAALLAESGIRRGKDWVHSHRVVARRSVRTDAV